MERLQLKRFRRSKRVKRVKSAIQARKPRPRLVLNCSNRYLSAQVIDDVRKVTICAASTKEKTWSGKARNKEAAARLGDVLAKRAVEKGVKAVVLDRRGRLYHGRLAEFANAARSGGLEF